MSFSRPQTAVSDCFLCERPVVPGTNCARFMLEGQVGIPRLMLAMTSRSYCMLQSRIVKYCLLTSDLDCAFASALSAARIPPRRVTSMAATIEFIKGVTEPCIPDVKLTRSRDGSSGTATFIFSRPSVFEAGNDLGEITGLYMNDDEGTLNTVDVQAKFVNGELRRCSFMILDSIPGFRNCHAMTGVFACLVLIGKPERIECVYVMKSAYDWDRFMRFMER